jgi:hypothetical protein
MDIAALSMGMNQTKLQQDSSLAVMKMAIDTAKGQGETISQLLSSPAKAMEQSTQPHLGGNLDINI